MINHALIEELAGLLDVETQEAGRLLKGFFSAMVTELLAAHKLSVKGLGSFKVTHVPLKKQSNTSGVTYTPPCNKLIFYSRISGSDDTVRIATTKLLLSSREAEQFGRSLAVILHKTVKQQREIQIKGLGLFSLEHGCYSFIPERSLEELLNREYKDLEKVVLSNNDSTPWWRQSKTLYYAIFLAALLVTCAVLTFLNPGNPAAEVPVSTTKQPENQVPEKIASSTHIQQLIKKTVFHGKKEL